MTITLADLAGDPHPHLARLRAASPVAFVPALDGYLVTSRTAAVEVLRDPDAFTVDDPRFATARVVGSSMLSLDGPAHAAHRAPFADQFRSRRVAERDAPRVAAIAGALLDEIVSAGPPADLRPALAGPLAAAVVAESLGLGGSHPDGVTQLLDWYRDIVASVEGLAAGRATTPAGAAAMTALAAALPPHVDPADAAVVMFGGIETTEGMILNALWHLLQHDAARAAVVARPALVDAAVEESLRMEPAATRVDRYATRDVSVAGVAIERGALVVVSLAAANRDPAEFPDPDRYDLGRPNVRRHLAFAAGPHVCLGMDLARLEAGIAVRDVLARLPGVRLDDGAPPPTGLVFRKPARLPVGWDDDTTAKVTT